MAPSKKSSASVTPRWLSPGSPDELDEAGRVAHGIITERSDLLPSVERIMTSGLDHEGRLLAISLFRDALHTPGDVHRNPRTAIVRGEAVSATPANAIGAVQV
jgi:hypothetical protein